MKANLKKIIILIILTVGGATLLILSPLAFIFLDSSRFDWARLANIGQAYGSVSVVISALALLGIAFSLVAQNHQAAIAKEYSHREQQSALLKMAIDDPALLACWGSGSSDLFGKTEERRRQMLYLTIVFTFWYSSWKVGALSEGTVRGNIADIFQGELARSFWSIARQTRSRIHSDSAEVAFDLIVETEYQRVMSGIALAVSQPDAATTSTEPSSSRSDHP
jgi:hypothetical protein